MSEKALKTFYLLKYGDLYRLKLIDVELYAILQYGSIHEYYEHFKECTRKKYHTLTHFFNYLDGIIEISGE